MISPCKECRERAAECHIACEKYLDWKEKRKAEEKMRQKARDGEPFLCRKVLKQIWHSMKYKR